MSKKTGIKTALAAAWICAATISSFADVSVVRSPLEIGSYIDVGQIVKGENQDLSGQVISTNGAVLSRSAVYLNQTTTINDRLLIKVGVGGLFYYAFPEWLGDVSSRTLRFGPGVGQAQGIYNWGDLNKPSWSLQFGYFPYKYNPDAKNLGEYLERDGTYPGYEVTGGWSYMNSALYMASGVRLNGNFLDGQLSADFNAFVERDIEPNHDISPSIVLAYKPTQMVEFGGGADFAHLIPLIPHLVNGNQYLISGDTLIDGAAAPRDSGNRISFQGVKLMARASVNFGALLNNPWIGKDGLKLYAEGAILGVKSYAFYYSDIWQRMPIMVGINLPTLDFFDVISFEYEYRKWGFVNSTAQVVDDNSPYWDVVPPSAGGSPYDPNNPPGNVKAQDNKWSFYAKKTIVKGIAIYTQVASDHLRGIGDDNTLSRLEITQRPSQWYYLFRLEFGI